ncbi:hypothetical protein J1P26_18515 [Neobacillus sp. MM2021_6]|uniref:hypothetical protein n=1 Tax=Bacillaceae TaxID=186817 RepID=UPI001409ED2E|nr:MULTISPECIES: hypothetical protein [Bacillaceae]MBO0961701.1 hypothetical protein [Neobacillus sp. MM2021_6]NHC18292.1 hypothetical protein [Bacillus sp. MM2020_4]
MNPVQLIQSLMNVENVQKATLLSLKPGQMFYGRVEKFLPNETAIVQIGSTRVVAQIKASLNEDRYIFEVLQSEEGRIQLKVVEDKGPGIPVKALCEQFHLPNTKQNQQLLQYFLAEEVPFTNEQLRTASVWINSVADTKELTALEWMIKKELPFTRQTFQSLIAIQETESFTSQLEKARIFLGTGRFLTYEKVESLKQMLESFQISYTMDELSSGNEVKQMLQTMSRTLGLDYENEVELWSKDLKRSIDPLRSLKPLLMSAIAELGTEGKELEPLLHRLTGLQLISQDLTGPMQQLVMQFPLTLNERQTDVTIQWKGHKTKNGQIDSDHCRILFYLDLESLKETVIDMQVQNRVVHICVINNSDELALLIPTLTPTLKEKLEHVGYKLSFIQVVPPNGKGKTGKIQMNPTLLSRDFSKRVDVKV